VQGALVDADAGAGAISTGGTTTAIGAWNPATQGGGPLQGDVAELIVYRASLSVAQRQAIHRWLAAKWGITLAPQVSNADAQDWVNRVYANGGTVSPATADAVNQFCVAIENAQIRDRFYRLNLFCGTGLAACLVPLYRGPSLGGAQYGNTTDTNNGPFVSGDYVETGSAAGGLKGNGSSKSLATGVAQNVLTAGDRHLAAYEIASSPSTFDVLIGSDNGVSVNPWILSTFSTAGTVSYLAQANASGNQWITSPSYSGGGGLWLGTGTAAAPTLYRNGSAVANTTLGVAATPGAEPVAVFALSRQGAIGDFSAARLGGYSIGLGMTAPQAAAYSTAMQTFQTALSRNV
jgi:hypothetical protein